MVKVKEILEEFGEDAYNTFFVLDNVFYFPANIFKERRYHTQDEIIQDKENIETDLLFKINALASSKALWYAIVLLPVEEYKEKEVYYIWKM